ncbi:helix-turn-helix domain-containing protein [Nocardioides sp.]|uniref:helix-turn-helix domain-containing protein n=1 Tax=Nocardioides sp. TaxID=35761 RepID=UPI003D126EB6
MASGIDLSALRTARERLGLTQHQLARLVGVAGGERISRWELGLDEPRPDSLARLARALNTHVVELLDVDAERRDLRALRYCAGLSAGEVAAAVHISARSYARWESGSWVRPPSAENLRAIARKLDVPVGTVRDALELARAAEQHRHSRPEA